MAPFGLFGPKIGHQPLFAELCKFHKLDRPTIKLLDRIVQTFQIKAPAELFLGSSWYEKAFAHTDFEADKDAIRDLSFRWFSRRL